MSESEASTIEAPVYNGLAVALAAFQAETPTFKKSKTAKVKMQAGGTYEYNYAGLGDILPVVNPLLGKHGLSWSSKPISGPNGEPTLYYRLLHASGECDEGEMPLGVPRGCRLQELGSALTYCRRYALTAQLNLAADEDDDGHVAQTAQAPHSEPRVTVTAAPPQRSEPAATPAQRKMIDERLARLPELSESERTAILQWVCGGRETWSMDEKLIMERVAEGKAQILIELLGEDGTGALQILNEIDSLQESDRKAKAIVDRYLKPSEPATNSAEQVPA